MEGSRFLAAPPLFQGEIAGRAGLRSRAAAQSSRGKRDGQARRWLMSSTSASASSAPWRPEEAALARRMCGGAKRESAGGRACREARRRTWWSGLRRTEEARLRRSVHGR